MFTFFLVSFFVIFFIAIFIGIFFLFVVAFLFFSLSLSLSLTIRTLFQFHLFIRWATSLLIRTRLFGNYIEVQIGRTHLDKLGSSFHFFVLNLAQGRNIMQNALVRRNGINLLVANLEILVLENFGGFVLRFKVNGSMTVDQVVFELAADKRCIRTYQYFEAGKVLSYSTNPMESGKTAATSVSVTSLGTSRKTILRKRPL